METVPKVHDTPAAARPSVTEEDVREALKDVVDPELGINIVDLGLLYGQRLNADGSATLELTLTSAACPLTDVIEDQVYSVLAGLVPSTTIEWVWSPPWSLDMLTEDGKDQLRAIGYNFFDR